MQYLFLIYANESAAPPPEAVPEAERNAELKRWFDYTDALKDAGVYQAGEALQPTSTATTVSAPNGDPVFTDGPFAETKEQLGGLYMVDCANLDDAMRWAAKCPGTRHGRVEVRPIVKFD